MIPGKCVTITADPQVKVSDGKSPPAVFANARRRKYKKIRFDGCVIKNAPACDWLLVKDGVGTLAVELKGSDVGRAAEQVFAGLTFASKSQGLPKRLAGLIVCTRYRSPQFDTKLQRIQVRALREFNAPVHVKTKERGRGLDFDDLLEYSRRTHSKG